MRAVLLVGGLGTRLRPLTDRCPKPLVPIANEPFMNRRLRYLGRQGIDEAILAVQYLAESFRAIYSGSSAAWPQIHIAEEPQPLGTAGAAAYAARQRPWLPGEPLLVFNGDLLTDLNVQALVDYHRRSGAVATIAVAEVDDPQSCGVVVADQTGRVSAFQEKPAPGSELARTVNTGVYVLDAVAFEQLAANRFVSFERDLFPTLLAQGLPVAAYRHTALWMDIGTLDGYLAANAAVLHGRVQDEPIPGRQVAPGIWAEDQVEIAASARLSGPILLGRGVTVGQRAVLTGPLAVGAASRIAAETELAGCVLWDRVSIGAGARLRGVALASGASVAAGERIDGEARA